MPCEGCLPLAPHAQIFRTDDREGKVEIGHNLFHCATSIDKGLPVGFIIKCCVVLFSASRGGTPDRANVFIKTLIAVFPEGYDLSQEGQLLDKKSLRVVTGKSADWNELAKDSVAFANATGGRLLIGIEDAAAGPPVRQVLPADLPDLVRRRLSELTVNVVALPEARTAENGAQYLELTIPRAVAVASTTDGRYYIRIADKSAPVTGDDVLRLASERAALPWRRNARREFRGVWRTLSRFVGSRKALVRQTE